MLEFAELIASMWTKLLTVLDNITFQVGDITVSLPSLWFAMLVIGLVITVFWKGART